MHGLLVYMEVQRWAQTLRWNFPEKPWSYRQARPLCTIKDVQLFKHTLATKVR